MTSTQNVTEQKQRAESSVSSPPGVTRSAPGDTLNTSFSSNKSVQLKSKDSKQGVADKLVERYSNQRAADETAGTFVAEKCPRLGVGRTAIALAAGITTAFATYLSPRFSDFFVPNAVGAAGWTVAGFLVAVPALLSIAYIVKESLRQRMSDHLRSSETSGLARQVLGLSFKNRNNQDARNEIATAKNGLGAAAELSDTRYQRIESATGMILAAGGLLIGNVPLALCVIASSLYLWSVEKQRTELSKQIVKKTAQWNSLCQAAKESALDPDTASQLAAMGKADWMARRVEQYANHVARLENRAGKLHLRLTRKGWMVTACTSLLAGSVMMYLAATMAVTAAGAASFVGSMLVLQSATWAAASLKGAKERASIKVQRNATLGKEIPRALAEAEAEAVASKSGKMQADTKHGGITESLEERQKRQLQTRERRARQADIAQAQELASMTTREREWLERLKGKELGFQLNDIQYREGEKTILNMPGSYTFKPRELVAIIGDSGAGKSTLIRLIVGTLDATSGGMNVIIKDPTTGAEEVVSRSEVPLRALQTFMGWSAQGGYEGKSLLISEYLDLGRTPSGRTPLTHEDALRFAGFESVTKKYDIDTARIGWDTGFSGGEKVRLRVAQTAMGNKPVEIWDEPHEGLDQPAKEHIIDRILSQRHSGKTQLYITHDYLGLDYVDRILILKQGKVVTFDVPDNVREFYSDSLRQSDFHRKYPAKSKPKTKRRRPPTPPLREWPTARSDALS